MNNIEKGHCCKPSNHPDGYGSCYTEDVGKSFEREGWTNCSKLGYYITGVFRGSGDWLKNIDKFQCCQMAAGNEITSDGVTNDVTNNHDIKSSSRFVNLMLQNAFLGLQEVYNHNGLLVICVAVIVANIHYVNFSTYPICIVCHKNN